MGTQDPIGSIGSFQSSQMSGLGVSAQQHQLESRLQQVRPTDLTRAQEAEAEPVGADQLDIPFEEPVAEAVEGEAPQAEGELEGEPVLDEAPTPDMQAELEQVRRQFEPAVANIPTSQLFGGNTSGLPIGGVTDGARPTDGFVPGGGWCGGGRGWNLMNGAMLGMTALSAFSPFMFGMPFMNPMNFMMFNSMNSMFTPMMAMMSTNMMMSQNMMMCPPMMNCMPYAFGNMPYQYPMVNPWTMPPQAPMPWMQPQQDPWMQQQQNPFDPGSWGGGPTGPVVARQGADGPLQSSLQNGAVSELSAVQRARLATLTPERQQAFQQLYDGYKGADLQLPGRADKVKVTEALGRLLETGKLDVRDRDGNDLLNNLSQMASQPMARGLDNRLITAQAIAQTASPANTMTQGDRGTCAAATVEYMLARKNPAEYVRVASGLMSERGAVDLASGKPIVRVGDSVAEDNSGRTALNRVVQAAFMNSEGVTSGTGTYSNRTDKFQNPNSSGWNPFSFMSPPRQDSGLTPDQVQDLAGHALNERYVEVFSEGQNPYQALPTIDRAARTPGSDGVPVSLQWSGNDRHRILVTRVENGRVYFRNPWGQRNSSNANDRIYGVDHQIGQDGMESIPVDAFAQRMRSAIVPQRLFS